MWFCGCLGVCSSSWINAYFPTRFTHREKKYSFISVSIKLPKQNNISKNITVFSQHNLQQRIPIWKDVPKFKSTAVRSFIFWHRHLLHNSAAFWHNLLWKKQPPQNTNQPTDFFNNLVWNFMEWNSTSAYNVKIHAGTFSYLDLFYWHCYSKCFYYARIVMCVYSSKWWA